ncbi:MBL fold metallo-hydrolase [Flammeovirga yaeyamensis]|uniref:MBL fold metallo-hydrolase n=1 Tax=Flammeovirga yaeyamensis TaxID=367791 RepID=A0AAX1N486_9BACT|nr:MULTISPECIES: MBL fold metallo-hydrolase [Flammeovirga]MBB3698455.1 phosphoribosyl 1,2-cyclic phosphate phosphodiesterase [Flammeovirga yaeyamensis]NMF34196.1 MBL fold metallo-hydrolase [Flammeovirga yaeyamensis]QJD09400.1 MBL fold metallo-hydrolase [Flammeovirga sp. MY04]QWG01181.1 MBL fold metallo-hydrolase [Flammeovirga yaeyamensis]
MRITFLGTGTSQGIPIIGCQCEVCTSLDYRNKRLRSSIHIQTDNNESIIIDSGTDFRQQVLRERITQLDGLLFTHQHKDHTAGMDDIRGFYFLNGMKPIELFATAPVFDQLKQEFSYIFAKEKYPGVPSVNLNTLEKNKTFKVGKTDILPIEVYHYKLPVLGYRIKNFAYITDANRIEADQMDQLKGLDILVINALQKEKHISHFTLDEAKEVIKELKPKKAYITHIGHKMGLHADVQKDLPENVFLSEDGLVLEL